MNRLFGLVIMATMLLFSSAGFASHAPPEQKANSSQGIYFENPGADISANLGCDWAKVFAIMPVDFISCTFAVQNPNEGLRAYGWDKDKRNRVFICRSDC